MSNLAKYIDHTNLKPFATDADIQKLCGEARSFGFMSVCVNPCNVAKAKAYLEGSDVKVCTVIGFPLGANETRVKAYEAECACEAGCDELDMVINVGALKAGRLDDVKNDVAAVVAASGGRLVKAIIETGLLTDEEKVTAVKLCCEAGVQFVKTCSGVSQGVATVADVKLMKANAVGGVKVKASSGIRTYEDAAALIEAGAERLGTSAGAQILAGAGGKA